METRYWLGVPDGDDRDGFAAAVTRFATVGEGRTSAVAGFGFGLATGALGWAAGAERGSTRTFAAAEP